MYKDPTIPQYCSVYGRLALHRDQFKPSPLCLDTHIFDSLLAIGLAPYCLKKIEISDGNCLHLQAMFFHVPYGRGGCFFSHQYLNQTCSGHSHHKKQNKKINLPLVAKVSFCFLPKVLGSWLHSLSHIASLFSHSSAASSLVLPPPTVPSPPLRLYHSCIC